MAIDRREFLRLGALGALASRLPGTGRTAQQPDAAGPADHTIRIAAGLVEISPNRFIATTLYNGQFPGPMIRLREGRLVTIDVFNDTDRPEQVHWHGQLLPIDVDGAAEEGTPAIPPHGHRRLTFSPGPSGLRLYHTHAFAGPDLHAGLYGGQFGLVYVEPAHDPGAYDQEIFLVLKEFSPFLTRMGDMEGGFLAPKSRDRGLETAGEAAKMAALAKGVPSGFDVEYRDFTINGKSLGSSDPIRVRLNERVLIHVANASATEIRGLALPGHTFRVVALDGNPVTTPADAPVVWIAPGERVSALVHMTHPGVWMIGDVGDDRFTGMGIVVEYAGATGRPAWVIPDSLTWDYTHFGLSRAPAAAPDETIDMVFTEEQAADQGFSRWLINGSAFSMADMKPALALRLGRRYRLRLRNQSDEIHPVHLHRHVFELTNVAGRATSGVFKDVAMVGAYQELALDFTANSPGLSLFHCHMQSHMDHGFMALFDCR